MMFDKKLKKEKDLSRLTIMQTVAGGRTSSSVEIK